MKIKKFIKKNYKKLIIQFVSMISAFVIFAIPCMAESNQQIIEGSNLWFTNCSLNSNVNENGFGNIVNYIKINNSKYLSGDNLSDYVHTGMWAQYTGADSVPWSGKCYVATILLPESISIKKEQSYTLEIPLVYIFGDYETSYALETNLLRISLWDNSGSYGNGTFDFYSTDVVKWSPTYYKPLEDTSSGNRRMQNKVKVQLSNYSNKDYNVNYILVAFRISNGVNLYPTSGFGIYDDIVVTNDGKVYASPDTSKIDDLNNIEQNVFNSTETGRHNILNLFNTFQLNGPIGSGMLAVTKILNKFLGISAFSSLTNVSMVVGLCAFLLGIFGTWGALSRGNRDNSNNKKGSGK